MVYQTYTIITTKMVGFISKTMVEERKKVELSDQQMSSVASLKKAISQKMGYDCSRVL